LAVGSWQLAVGSWQLAVGSWQLAEFSAFIIIPVKCFFTYDLRLTTYDLRLTTDN